MPPEGGVGGASGGEDYVGAGDGADGDGGDPSSGSGFDTPESGVEWQVGWFVAFPLPATSCCSLLVGKIMGVVRGEEGESLRYTGIRLREVRYHAVGPCTERGGGLKRSN